MEKEKHLSDSEVQRKIEAEVLKKLSDVDRFNTDIIPLSLHLDGYRFDVDGVIGVSEIDGKHHFEEDIHLFEVYARIGKLQPGHKRKIKGDVLKLVTVEKQIKKLSSFQPQAIKKYIVLVDNAVHDQITGQNWLASTLNLFGFEVIVVEISEEDRKKLKSTIKDQAEGFKKGKKKKNS